DSLDELKRLCDTAGLDVRGRCCQAVQHPSAATFVGSGKLEEIRDSVEALAPGGDGGGTVVFDDELSPAQQRNLQLTRPRPVPLRLQIFAQRARTREAKLQVTLARMRYMLPRL
ncbi:hypothetical protein EMIHUDRAFT_47551, partial [Emiliania huxleyi CCMP1516]|uniref:GTPase HflX N-terminal domain-containing protein n=2 Tax=Emiliania huxleyi TaxID=2903 RepID=A0A0D3I3R3_EMIH1